jgi:LmbE family N-acetylglucosaminyl deacetylase
MDRVKTRADIPNLKPADVLLMLAHPDDDILYSGAVLNLRDKGYTVQTVYTTPGENGKDITNRFSKGDQLAAVRREELLYAARTMNLDRPPLILGYVDGETAQPHNQLAIANDVLAILQKTQPRLVLTFGPDGMTSHADHITIGKLTDFVVKSLNQGKPPEVQTGLYHVAMSPDARKAFTKAMDHPNLNAWTAMQSVSEDKIRVIQDFRDFIPEKIASVSMFRTQFSPEEVLRFNALYRQRPWEEYADGSEQTVPKASLTTTPQAAMAQASFITNA